MKDEYELSQATRGAVLSSEGKTRITLYIDNSVLEELRARAEQAGTGYQTLINEGLKSYLAQVD